MKKITLILLIGLILISSIGLIAIYNSLPDEIPGHFAFDGSVNRYDNKSALLFTGSLPIVILIMYYILPKIDPRKNNYRKHKKAYAIFIITVVVFVIVTQWSIVAVSLGYDVNIEILIKVLVGLLFIILGNYMGQFRQNYFFGIKTPWTLASEYVWRKTHRFGSYCFIIGGFFMIILGLVSNAFINKVGIILLVALLLLPCIYSYVIYTILGDKNQ